MTVNTCLDISSQDIKRKSSSSTFATIMFGALLTAVSVPAATDIEKITFFLCPA